MREREIERERMRMRVTAGMLNLHVARAALDQAEW